MNSLRLFLLTAVGLLSGLNLFAADVSGTWKGTMTTQMGATELTITIKPGTPLTGELRADEYSGPIENAKLAGNKISFESNIGPGKLVVEGTVAGDEMKLNVTGTQGDKYKLTCKRQK
ncbi:MAG: hypothetical protein HY821_21255 [Acidobacteria bacterium]|nr:hypothetical protein [Acidobacteriota bacterium]